MKCIHVDNDRDLEIDTDGDALVLKSAGRKTGSVPLGNTERIILHGDTRIQARALAKIGSTGAGLIVMLGIKHEPTVFLPRAHHDASIRLGQYHAHTVHRLQEARLVLLAKWQSQVSAIEGALQHQPEYRLPLHAALRQLREVHPHLQTMSTLHAMMGWEGGCAEIYYQALSARMPPWAGFERRNRRPPKDPANVLMSLSYTLAQADAVMSAHQHGLDPDIGMLHALEFSRASLACDLIEPLRAPIDDWIVNQLQTGVFAAADFAQTDTACQMSKSARARFYQAWEAARPPWRALLDKECQARTNRWRAKPCVT